MCAASYKKKREIATKSAINLQMDENFVTNRETLELYVYKFQTYNPTDDLYIYIQDIFS